VSSISRTSRPRCLRSGSGLKSRWTLRRRRASPRSPILRSRHHPPPRRRSMDGRSHLNGTSPPRPILPTPVPTSTDSTPTAATFRTFTPAPPWPVTHTSPGHSDHLSHRRWFQAGCGAAAIPEGIAKQPSVPRGALRHRLRSAGEPGGTWESPLQACAHIATGAHVFRRVGHQTMGGDTADAHSTSAGPSRGGGSPQRRSPSQPRRHLERPVGRDRPAVDVEDLAGHPGRGR